MPGVWIIYLSADRGLTDGRKRLREACKSKGWQFAERTVSDVRDVEGRPLKLLSSRDANEVYRAAHRDLILVIDLAHACIQIDPREPSNRLSSRRVIFLNRLIEYKSIYHKLNEAQFYSEFNSLIDELAITYTEASRSSAPDSDPRALPFIPFDLGSQINVHLELNLETGRDVFEENFGPQRNRRDSRERRWPLNVRAYHGRETPLLRGKPLPTGMHWDVNFDSGGGEICTATEVWKLKRGQYINIYPDMAVRTTREDGGRRIWP